jgi:hypothetical protein
MRSTLIGCATVIVCVAAAAETALEQRSQSFTITLNGSVERVTPFFGPVQEAEWAPGWRPRFLRPPEGGQRQGAVFTTTSANGRERLWLVTAYDVKAGRVEYVLLTPGFTANEIKIQVLPNGRNQSKATITYRHSALTAEGNEEVAKLDTHWAEQERVHWESAINSILAKGAKHD